MKQIGVLQLPIIRATSLYLILVCLLAFASLILLPVLAPLVASFVLYALLQPYMLKLEARGMNNTVAIIILIAAVATIISVCVMVLIPLATEQFTALQQRLPKIWSNLLQITNLLAARIQQSSGFEINISSMMSEQISSLKTQGVEKLLSSAGSFVNIAMALVLIPIITFFMLKDFRGLRNRAMSWLPNRGFELAWLIYYQSSKQLQRYLRGVMIQSAIIALIASVGFYFIGLEMAFLFGSLTGLLNLIPYIGPLLAIAPPLFISLGMDELNYTLIWGIPLVVLTVQIIDNLVVVPSFIANTVNLHPLTVILGIIIFGAVFGFAGMLLAIPAMTASKIVFNGLLYGLNGADRTM